LHHLPGLEIDNGKAVGAIAVVGDRRVASVGADVQAKGKIAQFDLSARRREKPTIGKKDAAIG